MLVLWVHEHISNKTFLKFGLTKNKINFDEIGISFFTEGKVIPTQYDWIILDIPSVTSDIAEIVHKTIPNTPIFVICQSEENIHNLFNKRIIADYIVAPFEFAYFVQRLEARRSAQEKISVSTPQGAVRIANLHIDFSANAVRRGDLPIKLTVTEFALLRLLAERKDSIVMREEISEFLWQSSSEEQINRLSVFISYLRRKIDTNFEPKLIHTVPKKGYILSERIPDK